VPLKKLKHSLPLGALVSIINRSHAIFLNERLKPYNLSFGQFPVFMCLLKHPDIMQESMARHFHLDKGTIARTVRKMEDAGYILRSVDPTNRRAFRLSLTEKGIHIAPEIMAIDRIWQETVCAGLSDSERQSFLSLLHQVTSDSLIAIEILERESCNVINP
jgi:DNA-binding MarR family transcriptional regulator